MAGEWKVEPLARLVDPDRSISYGIVQPGVPRSDGVPIVRVTDIRDGRIAAADPLRVSREVEAAYARTRLRGGELLLTLVGTVGETAIVPNSLAGWNTARAVAVIPVRADVGSYWVKLALRSPEVRHVIDSRLNTTVQATLNLRDVAQLPIALPPKRQRDAIAHILGTLDDKIDLNLHMSETLEALARALFKSWFVHFDPVRARLEGRESALPKPLADLFPTRLVDSELGEIPEGWAVREFQDIADLEKGLSYKGNGLVADGGLPLVNLGCFAGAGRFKRDSIKRYFGEYRPRHLVRAGDLVIANTDMTQNRVIIGSPALLPALTGERDYLFSHHTYAVRFKPGAERWKLYAYFWILRPEFREIAEGYATGTTVLALPRDGVLRYRLVLPTEELRAVFEHQAALLLAKTEVAVREGDALSAVRDTLLPELVSGALRVKDAEQFIGRVV